MGMFDSVYFICPVCGTTIELQSKADECMLASYPHQEVPNIIAEDLKNYKNGVVNCEKCNTQLQVVEIPSKRTQHLELVRISSCFDRKEK